MRVSNLPHPGKSHGRSLVVSKTGILLQTYTIVKAFLKQHALSSVYPIQSQELLDYVHFIISTFIHKFCKKKFPMLKLRFQLDRSLSKLRTGCPNLEHTTLRNLHVWKKVSIIGNVKINLLLLVIFWFSIIWGYWSRRHINAVCFSRFCSTFLAW